MRTSIFLYYKNMYSLQRTIYICINILKIFILIMKIYTKIISFYNVIKIYINQNSASSMLPETINSTCIRSLVVMLTLYNSTLKFISKTSGSPSFIFKF